MKAIPTKILLLTLLLPSLAIAQSGYPLVCRGGGSMQFRFEGPPSEPELRIIFERAPQPAGSHRENLAALGPGQCTWLDRVISSDEPNKLVQQNVQLFSISWQNKRVVGISSSLHHLNQLQNPTTYQVFQVHNDGIGQFVIDAILDQGVVPHSEP